jgi:[acyl-carrier-protein] S-malonyltransferase
MASAVEGFTQLVAGLQPQDAHCDVVANADGAVLRDGRVILDRLVTQLTRPVRFDLCLAALEGPVVELAPAGVLSALVRRSRPDLPVTALRAPSDLMVDA